MLAGATHSIVQQWQLFEISPAELCDAAFKIRVLYQSSECGGSPWYHTSSTVFSVKKSDLWLPCLYQAQQ